MSPEIVYRDRCAVLVENTLPLGRAFRGADAEEQATHFVSWLERGDGRAALAEHPMLGYSRPTLAGDGTAPEHYDDKGLRILHNLWESLYLQDDGRLTDEAWKELAQ